LGTVLQEIQREDRFNIVEIDSREIRKVGKLERKSVDRKFWRRRLKMANVRFRAVAPKKEEEEEEGGGEEEGEKKKISWPLLSTHIPYHNRPPFYISMLLCKLRYINKQTIHIYVTDNVTENAWSKFNQLFS
jgi:hypothetical protein